MLDPHRFWIARLLHAAALLSLSLPCAAQTTWHVDDDASSGGDGLSWAGAFARLEEAFFQAQVGDRIWVAEGSYLPLLPTDPGDNRTVTFLVPQGVKMYGGFAGWELSLDERVGLFRTTILSGDVGVGGDATDNAYHVVTVKNPSGPPPGVTRVDGFVIKDGNANGPGESQGGGLFSWNSATFVANCIVTRNTAVHGAAFHAQPGSLRLIRCTVTDNHALDKGGALWGQVLNLYALHCTFARNTSEGKGGAIYLHSIGAAEGVRFVGCLFHDNAAETGGAAFLGGGQFASGKAVFRGCTFAYNQATISGGGLRAVTVTTIPADSRIYDCIVWRNRAPIGAQLQGAHTVRYSDVGGGADGVGNIDANPRFVDEEARIFRLRTASPCIDAGDNSEVPNDQFDVDGNGDTSELLPWDLARQPRLTDAPGTPDTGSGRAPIVDLGAYEYQP